jgi:hypothetical protein
MPMRSTMNPRKGEITAEIIYGILMGVAARSAASDFFLQYVSVNGPIFHA